MTFGYNGSLYGSCDACWYTEEDWIDRYDGSSNDKKPVIALEGTDALNRGSVGNAQKQRFHHALGAVRSGLIGIYYLRKGKASIQPDLFGMACNASQYEDGYYLIIDDLGVVERILQLYETKDSLESFLNSYLLEMKDRFNAYFNKQYGGDWNRFAAKRSTIIKEGYVVKYAARMRRSFTDSSQRGGHIAVGEMYLTKYLFYGKQFCYLFPRMTHGDIDYLDEHKAEDKEWHLLRTEPDVRIVTIDDIEGLNPRIKADLMSIRDEPLNGGLPNAIYSRSMKHVFNGLQTGTLRISGCR